jgi:hypothetical protein
MSNKNKIRKAESIPHGIAYFLMALDLLTREFTYIDEEEKVKVFWELLSPKKHVVGNIINPLGANARNEFISFVKEILENVNA